MIGLALGLGARQTVGIELPTPPAGTTRPAFDLAPEFLYQPQTETGTTLSSGAVSFVTGISSPDLTVGASGPLELTDALGRKFWRFRGTDYLEIATSDLTFTPRAMTVLMVGRQWAPTTACNFFGQSTLSDGTTVDSFSRAFLASRVISNSVNQLHAGLRAVSTASGGITFGAIGAQLQAFGVSCNASRSRYLVNEQAANGTVIENTNADMKGARIGGYQKSNGTTNYFDLYAIAAFKGTLTDEQADAAIAALVAEYDIAPVTRQIVVEGDSITASSFSNLALSVGGVLGEPGTGRIPDGTRILPLASSGAGIGTLETRKQATNGWPATVLPGGSANNIVAFQIGVNDRAVNTASEEAGLISDYIGAATIGAFARGFDVAVGINIAAGNATIEAYLDDLRTELRSAGFLTGLDAQSGGANEGRVQIIELEQIEQGGAGNKPFESPVNTDFYNGDQLHPNVDGALLLTTGGDTPANGFAAVLP